MLNQQVFDSSHKANKQTHIHTLTMPVSHIHLYICTPAEMAPKLHRYKEGQSKIDKNGEIRNWFQFIRYSKTIHMYVHVCVYLKQTCFNHINKYEKTENNFTHLPDMAMDTLLLLFLL